MKFIDEEFSYYITEDLNREVLFGLKDYFPELAADKDFKLNNISKFINSRVIGNIMFEFLENSNIEYSEKTQSRIEYFRFYLDKCIENNEYCNNKIFLPCIRENLSLNLPRFELCIDNFYTIEQRCNYKIIHANSKDKTSIIFSNRNNITYSKIYYCTHIEDLFIASLFELFDRNYTIRKCKNCNKFFVTVEQGKRIKYCYNASPQNPSKTCYEYYSQSSYVQKRRENPIRCEYTKLYNKFNNRYIRVQNASIEKYSFEKENLSLEELNELKSIYKSLNNNLKLNKVTKEYVLYILKNYEKGGKEQWQYRK